MPQENSPLISSDEDAASVVRLIQGGHLQGDALETALGELRAHEANVKNAAAVPHSMTEPSFLERGLDFAKRAGSAVAQHPLEMAAGAVENTVAGMGHGLDTAATALTRYVPGVKTRDPGNPDERFTALDYQPSGEGARTVANLASEATGEIGRGADIGLQKAGASDALRQTLEERVPQALEATTSVAALPAAARLVRGAAGGAVTNADRAVNAVAGPSAEQAANVASNPAIARARAAGFQLTGNDIRRAVPSAPDSELPGSTRQSLAGPNAVDTIRRNNAAHATETMAQDVGLPNTRAVDPEEMSTRVQQEASVMQRAADAGGTRPASRNLQADLSRVSGADAATRESANAVDQQARFYQQQYGENFNGPQALQSIRALRSRGYKQLSSGDANQLDVGHANLDIANALEEELKRNIPVQQTAAGITPEAFDQARSQLAKLHELDAVTRGGQVDPAAVLRLRDSGAPLSGASAEVAHAADVGRESMGISQGQTSGIHAVYPSPHGLVYAGARAVGAITRRLPGMNPASEAFQTANYGPRGAPAAPEAVGPPTPAPGLERLAPPPGRVSEPVQTSMALPQGPPARPGLELQAPPGAASAPLQRSMALPRAEWDRKLLSGIQRRQRFVGEPQ